MGYIGDKNGDVSVDNLNTSAWLPFWILQCVLPSSKKNIIDDNLSVFIILDLGI